MKHPPLKPAGVSLGELAVRFGCELRGDPDVRITCVATLQEAGPDAIAYLANIKLLRLLPDTRAGAVIIDAKFAPRCPAAALIVKNPHAVYARVAALLHPPTPSPVGVHATSVIDSSAMIDPTASVAAHCVIGASVCIGPRAVIGPSSVVFENVFVGADTRLVARVTLCERVTLGERCLLHPGVVIGADGFGLAPDAGTWLKVPQVGSVRIGNDVEIGANTTIDRGAIGDTVIEDGVKLDNQIQIGHNVRVGAHTAMAAGVGIAGSTTIGKHCLIAGKVGISGHLEICDGVIINGHSTVSGSITKPGSYSGALGLEETRSFRRNAARFRQLDSIAKQVRRLGGDAAADASDTDDNNE
ncbi:MAG: UDP-3-O-(3-hydroxymyristoyl)glucosamine N-acyltransferase [Candidatus Obscuribacterales bacterium]|nr:UDP-3-O-(3-hydroxymyristoyl)glucosamine N-acyltransferase [Steroidobacteraceae bacterium]